MRLKYNHTKYSKMEYLLKNRMKIRYFIVLCVELPLKYGRNSLAWAKLSRIQHYVNYVIEMFV